MIILEEEESIIEFGLEDLVNTWMLEKFDDIRTGLYNILKQTGVVLIVDEDVELINYEELNSFLKGEENE